MSTFAQSVAGAYTQPDSIAVTPQTVFVGYGNGVAKDGTDGKFSTIVEYMMTGQVVRTFSVLGHNDGLKINPADGSLWALQNEDGNPSLVVIALSNGSQNDFTFGPTPHGGGYDDIVFTNGKVFMTASNPANNPNSGPALVTVTLNGSQAAVVPVMRGDSTALDIPTNTMVTLNLQDPDSITLDPSGDIVMTSQADAELVIVTQPGSGTQSVKRLPSTIAGSPVEVDDTVFATSTQGTILVSDLDAGMILGLTASNFTVGTAFSASNSAKVVGKLDMKTGVVTPLITGLMNPRGMAFIAQ